MREITQAKIEKYLDITEKALSSIKIVPEHRKQAEEVLDMAQRYHADAQHYKEKGDFVTAFAAVNYAHGWLDAGARLGVLKVHKNFHFFTVERE